MINGVKRLLAPVAERTQTQSDKLEQLEGKIDHMQDQMDNAMAATQVGEIKQQIEGEIHAKIDGLEGQIREMQGRMDENMAKILEKLGAHPLMR